MQFTPRLTPDIDQSTAAGLFQSRPLFLAESRRGPSIRTRLAIVLKGSCTLQGLTWSLQSEVAEHSQHCNAGRCVTWHIGNVKSSSPHVVLQNEDFKTGTSQAIVVLPGMPDDAAVQAITNGRSSLCLILPELYLRQLMQSIGRTIFLTAAQAAKEAGLLKQVHDELTTVPESEETAGNEERSSMRSQVQQEATSAQASGGRIWTPRAILSCISVAWSLKNTDEFQQVIVNSLDFASACTDQDIIAPIRFPASYTIRRWRIHVDCMTMLFRRWQFQQGVFSSTYFTLGADASPQLQHNYLIVKEEAMQMPMVDARDTNPMRHLVVESRIKPVTTLGWGEANLEQQLVRMLHAIKLESGDCTNEYLQRVRTTYSDQGLEKDLWAAPNVYPPNQARLQELFGRLRTGQVQLQDADADDGYLFPNNLAFPGHLHVIYGAFRKAVTSMVDWPEIERHFRALATFLSKKGLRDRFAEICLQVPGRRIHKSLFRKWSGGVFTWKWDKLETFLLQLEPVLPVLTQFWSVQDMGLDDDPSVEVEKVTTALNYPMLPWVVHMLLKIGRAVGKEARWQEGCHCHGSMQVHRTSRYKRKRKRGSAVDHKCHWEGRRAVENAMGGVATGNHEHSYSAVA